MPPRLRPRLLDFVSIHNPPIEGLSIDAVSSTNRVASLGHNRHRSRSSLLMCAISSLGSYVNIKHWRSTDHWPFSHLTFDRRPLCKHHSSSSACR